MPRKKHKPEEIIQHLRTVELKQAKGSSLEEIARSLAVSAHTIIRWQKEYGSLKVQKLCHSLLKATSKDPRSHSATPMVQY